MPALVHLNPHQNKNTQIHIDSGGCLPISTLFKIIFNHPISSSFLKLSFFSYFQSLQLRKILQFLTVLKPIFLNFSVHTCLIMCRIFLPVSCLSRSPFGKGCFLLDIIISISRIKQNYVKLLALLLPLPSEELSDIQMKSITYSVSGRTGFPVCVCGSSTGCTAKSDTLG